MPIKEEISDGELIYIAFVDKRSSKLPGLRVQKKKSFKTIEEAKKFLPRLEEKVFRELLDREKAGVSWGSLLDRWELHMRSGNEFNVKIALNTLRDYVALLRTYTENWNNVPASLIGRAEVFDVLKILKEKGKTAKTMRRFLTTASKVFNYGIETRLLPPHFGLPTARISLERYRPNNEVEILTLEEMNFFIRRAKELNHSWFPVWFTAIHTGMRAGELWALKWSDVDLERKTITVQRSWCPALKSFKSTKSGEWRIVPISSALDRLLRDLKRSGGEFVLPRLPMWRNNEQAGVLKEFLGEIGVKKVKFHTLRACFATQLLASGIDSARIMSIGGWTTLKTMQIYIRKAGVNVSGATEALNIDYPDVESDNVIRLPYNK